MLTSVMARLAGRTDGLPSSSSVVPSRYPGVFLLRIIEVRPSRPEEAVWICGKAVVGV